MSKIVYVVMRDVKHFGHTKVTNEPYKVFSRKEEAEEKMAMYAITHKYHPFYIKEVEFFD